MEKGNLDGARIHAEAAIREKNQSLNYLRLSGRVDAIAQRIESAARMKAVTKNMKNVVTSMNKVIKQSLDVDKLTKVMDTFEQQFEDIDIASKTMENAMQSSMAVTTPESEVNTLLHMVADEYGLEFEAQLDGVNIVKNKVLDNTENVSKQSVPIALDSIGVTNQNINKENHNTKDNNDNLGQDSDIDNGTTSRGRVYDENELEARLRNLQGL